MKIDLYKKLKKNANVGNNIENIELCNSAVVCDFDLKYI